MTVPAYFEDVRARAAKRWEQLEGDPELAAPWRQLFTQVQSPRHVVSELLQNADDAGATRASVAVVGDEFVFSHNGDDFQPQHFSSLCRFGYSNKRALHTIGFRGIGFKSIFSLGDEVHLHTPTLSVGFRKQRFTEPYWLDGTNSDNGETTIRVALQDERRRIDIEKNLSHWLQSPASLLFFRSMRHLRIGDEDVIWQSAGAGPVANSTWMNLASAPETKVLLISSAFEEFPADAVAEIRQERMLGDGEDLSFPPCTVEVVLGLEGRLFVILPTGVKTALPFACNAPFVQDPARVKIKDPETSPTNRWLLERIGRLAGQAMLSWLGRSDVPTNQRARAYRFLPEAAAADDSIEAECTKTIVAAFDEAIANQPLLLTDAGRLVTSDDCITVPAWLTEVWEPEQAITLFDSKKRALFSRDVAPTARDALLRQGRLSQLTTTQLLDTIRDNHLPRPETWQRLLLLWSSVAPHVVRNTFSWQSTWKSLRIVPVQGQDCLYAAHEVVRLGEKRLLHADEDWAFLAGFLIVMNPNWGRYLTEQRRVAELDSDDNLAAQLTAAENVMHAIGLAETADAGKVLDSVASAFFEREDVPVGDCVRLAHIAAALDAKVSATFEFVTQAGTRTSRSQTPALIADSRFDLDSFVAEAWCHEHTLAGAYWETFTSCTPDEWKAWLESGQSGLLGFVPLESRRVTIRGRDTLKRTLAERGFVGEFSFPYVTSEFIIEDWDFAAEHWQHWESLALTDAAVWGKLLTRILDQAATYWSKCLAARVVQVSTSHTTRGLDVYQLAPAWILKLRSKACLQDTWGKYRDPAELLRRTPATESLLDVEPFVRAELDQEANRPLLSQLGVRDVPTGPHRLLERLRAIASVKGAPVYEVQKWCHRLDAMLLRCSTEEFQEIKDAFTDEKLILATDGSWMRAGEIFLAPDDLQIPGAAIIHPEIRSLMLWQKMGVPERPTLDVVVAWLKSLPANEKLSAEDLRRIKELLPMHPHRIWNDSGRWLNLEGEWVPVGELKFALSMQSLSSWGHLFTSIKRQVADLTRLSGEVLSQSPFSELPSLSSQLDERVQRNLLPKSPPQSLPWLAALGEGLSRVVTEVDERTNKLRVLGARLARTVWHVSDALETIPYLNGVPAGTARPCEVLWTGDTLFIQDRPRSKLLRPVARELARPFDDDEVEDAIKFCFDRDERQVRDYLEQNFVLDAPIERVPPAESVDRPEIHTTVEGADQDTATTEEDIPEVPPSDSSSPDGEITTAPEIESVTDPEPVTPPSPSPEPPPPRVRQTPLIERYAHNSGFRREAAVERFHHADGRWIQKEQGGAFQWEMYSPKGELLKCLLAKEHCLSEAPLQIGAEVWEACRRSPAKYSLLLTRSDGTPLELSGQRLLELTEVSQLELHPATYRLVCHTDDSRLEVSP